MHRNFAFRLFSFLSLGVFLHAGVLFAQSGNSGTISGVVKDPSGAVVAGATVSIHNPVSGYDRTATTDSTGSFTLFEYPAESLSSVRRGDRIRTLRAGR